ncbi:ABC transporter substrate-binding protein [Rhodococcus sp. NPDC058521]|uniref:ABC transporter substrate-binding protein n=1 Tax=Rhodococcus sp. NPDC058521 TaxID=3346536 RepID=UPI0036534217
MNNPISPISVNRRGFLVGALALAGTAGLAACGNGGKEAATTSSGEAGTREIVGQRGAVQIPVDPQRVVCVDHYTPGALLDVDYTPTAIAEFDASQVFAEYTDVYKQLPKVGKTNSADAEKVATFNPDLILGTYLPHAPDPGYDRYLALAPTVLFATSQAGDWKDRAVAAADAVGRKSQAEDLRKRYEERAADLKKTYAKQLESTKWAMVQGSRSPNNWILTLPQSWGGIVLTDIGVQFIDYPDNGESTAIEYSFEEMGTLDAADVIVVQADNTGAMTAPMKTVTEQPIWQSLTAVKAGKAIPVPYFNILHYKMAMAMQDKVEEILQGL